ncbi:MAG TPA: nuclear transport factor 2 family protein [Acidimicrobiia bacterium]|nr:nuclear transport factor 2 family protein [Acidimicrobiia bacterium]
MTELEDRVRRLEDILEIHQLFVDYGLALDAGDFDAYAALFADDGEVLLGPMGRAKGREEIKALMTGTLGGRAGTSFHIISSPQVQLDGDTATSEVMWSVVTRDESGRAGLTMIGRHRDDLVRERGRWKIARRRGFVDIPSTMPAGSASSAPT